MRILQVHNYTQQRGGADEAVEQEAALLQQHGHAIAVYQRHNDEIKDFSVARQAQLFFEPTWSRQTYRDVTQQIRTFQPDVLHCHSFFPLVSPSVYAAAAAQGVPVVQTLHEYRLLCPVGWLLRDGQLCTECVDHSLLRGIRYGCYQGSAAKTAAVALMLQVHRWRRTWWRQVQLFVTPTEFARQTFRASGLLPDRIWVHPNFLSVDPGVSQQPRTGALFVGRLSAEKGIVTLLNAWRQLPHVPLHIIGAGPLQNWVETFIAAHQLAQVTCLGYQPLPAVLAAMKQAQFLLLPSIFYETFGRTIMEAYATGTPVIASRLGAMAELVQVGETGWLCAPGDAADLATTVQQAIAAPDQCRRFGQQARQFYDAHFTPAIAYQRLLAIYQQAQTQAPR